MPQRKPKSEKHKSKCVADVLSKWRQKNDTLDSLGRKQTSGIVHGKGSMRGCMKGKGGPDKSGCNYIGVRQRSWGKWVAEIREPNPRKRLRLGTFDTAIDAAILAYDEAAKAIYGSHALLNLPASESSKESSNESSSMSITRELDRIRTPSHSDLCPVDMIDPRRMEHMNQASETQRDDIEQPASCEATTPMNGVREETREDPMHHPDLNEIGASRGNEWLSNLNNVGCDSGNDGVFLDEIL